MKTLKFAALALAATAALTTVGCSGEGDGGEKKLLGIVSITATDALNASTIKGATEAAEAAGWTVEVVDAQGNADTGNQAMVNFASKGASLIFDLVFPATSLGAGIQAANDANIPVVTWGGGLADGVAFTTGDGGPFAEPGTKDMIEKIGPNGKVLALTYRTGQVCRDRETVFDEILKDYPNIEVTKNEVNIPGYAEDAAQYATAWLAANPEGEGNYAVWGCWEDPTLGAVASIKQAGRTDVLTYGINGSKPAIEAVQAGELTATTYEDAVAEGKNMFETGLKVIEAGDSWEQQSVDVPGILVTKDNVEQFIKDHPEAMQE
ncbi:MAG: sugar ABC transporter substrate-binding protein [Propionibacteriaceae bacterium]|jgi:ribose transport system substrate-binding protein|nr:sugar ABC transporter substrate-binding protein [Propionibacteriaceae bacterium]